MESKKYVFPHKARTAFRTLTSYALDIKNSLTYTLSNGVVEGTVNKIKMIKRSGVCCILKVVHYSASCR